MRARIACWGVCLGLLIGGPAQALDWPSLGTPPPAAGGGAKDAALIVGVEDYAFLADVPGASENAADWLMWLTKTRGVPLSRVALLRNQEGTKEMILHAATEAAMQVERGGVLWFVFIGHGAPAKDQKDGVLVGADAQQSALGLYARSIPQKELAEVLRKGKQEQTLMVIDACFSGRSADGGAIAKGLQPLLPAKLGVPAKTLVLSAGKSDEFAGPLKGRDRPAFSYLVLGALRGWGDADRDGKVTAEEALLYARDAIRSTVRGRKQTPQILGGGGGIALAKASEAGPDLAALLVGRVASQQPAAPPSRPQPPTPPVTPKTPPTTPTPGVPTPAPARAVTSGPLQLGMWGLGPKPMHAKAAKKSAWDLRKLEELESSPKLPDVQRAEILNRVGDLLWEMGRANEVGYRPTKMGLDPYPALEPAFKAYVKIESLGQFAARDMEWKLRAGQLLVASGLATADAARTEKGVAVLKSIVVNYPDSPHSAYALVQICEALAANPSTGQKCYQRVAGGGDAYALAQYRLAELAADPAAKSKHLKLAKAQAKDKELRAAIELALNP